MQLHSVGWLWSDSTGAMAEDRRNWRPFVYGGLASVVAELGTFPIDTTKTRLQVQGQKIDKSLTELKYRGMTDAFIKITSDEGFRALYSGIAPAILRQATYGTIKFGTYYSLKQYCIEHDLLFNQAGKAESVWGNVLIASLAGAISSAIATPTDVLKVRLQVSGKGQKKGIFSSFYEIYQTEGVRGLWRGVGPTSQRAIVNTAVDLPLYDFCKSQFLEALGNSVTNHFISSFIASFGCALATTPIDVVRTRLMNQKRLIAATGTGYVPAIYKSSLDCLVQTLRNEGFFALYKGFIPTWMRLGPWNIIFFVTYEQLKKF